MYLRMRIHLHIQAHRHTHVRTHVHEHVQAHRHTHVLTHVHDHVTGMIADNRICTTDMYIVYKNTRGYIYMSVFTRIHSSDMYL